MVGKTTKQTKINGQRAKRRKIVTNSSENPIEEMQVAILDLYGAYTDELIDAERSGMEWSEVVEGGWDTFGGWMDLSLKMVMEIIAEEVEAEEAEKTPSSQW